MTKLLWIRKRARRIMSAYDLAKGNCKCIRVAVMAAYQDWLDFHPGETA